MRTIHLTKLSLAAVATAGALCITDAAQAQDNKWYVFGAGGINIARDSDFEGPGFNVDAEYDNGFVGLFGVGRQVRQNIRTELELGYRGNDIDQIGGLNGAGDVTAWSFFANVLFDIPLGAAIKPYLGLGVGGLRLNADGVTPVAGTIVDDSDLAFGLQGIAGLEYALTDRLNVNLSYRYLLATSADYKNSLGRNVDADYHAHAIMIGLRYSFGGPERMAQRMPEPAPRPAPPPAAQPAPPPAPRAEIPRRFIVFFDWNSAALTAEARTIIRNAANAARQGNIVRIELTGHADRSGPDRYNMGLSQRRAVAVRDELVRNGVAAGGIATAARGESQPLVPTADGVREPQNRRVEIAFPGQ